MTVRMLFRNGKDGNSGKSGPRTNTFMLFYSTQVAGVCTSLGLGAAQISTGAKRMGWMDDDVDDLTDKNVIIIWTITVIATISVVSGLSVGIKLLSQAGFGLGLALLFLVLVMEKTSYLFNLHVQTIGFYFQWCLFQVRSRLCMVGSFRKSVARP